MFYTSQRRGRLSDHAMWGLVAFLLIGCASSTPTQNQPAPAQSRPEVAVQSQVPQKKPFEPTPIKVSADTCEMRLHDLCGPLLLYYVANLRLPDKLEDLAKLGVLEKGVDFNCPITHKPYVYVKDGLTMPDGKGGILAYDSEPHNGIRWAIQLVWPDNSPKPLALVIPLTDETFRALKVNP